MKRVVLRDGRRGYVDVDALKHRRTRWLLTVELETGGTTAVELSSLRDELHARPRARAREGKTVDVTDEGHGVVVHDVETSLGHVVPVVTVESRPS